MAEKDEKLNGLSGMLMGVENKLMGRALARDRAELDQATDFINDMADKDIINIDCTGGEGASGEELPVIPEEPSLEMPLTPSEGGEFDIPAAE